MEMSQFTTIVITMVISVISKEVITWAWNLLKTIVVTDTIKAKLRAIFTRSNLRILYDLITIGVFVFTIASIGWTDKPLSGKDVLVIGGAVILLLLSIINLLVDIGRSVIRHETSKSPTELAP